MTTTTRGSISALALVAVVAGAAPSGAAQERPIEFGVDATFSHARLDDRVNPAGETVSTTSTGFVAPSAGVRFGFRLGDRVALDVLGGGGIGRTSTDDEGVTSWNVSLTPGLVYYFADAGRHTQPYVRADAGPRVFDTSRSDMDAAWMAGVAGGIKVPVAARAFVRLEAGYARQFESDAAAAFHRFSLGTGLVAVIN